MGYCTNFELTHDDVESAVEAAIKTRLEAISGYNFYGLSTPLRAEGKWYGWPDDMKKLSREFPAVKFLLNGEGEEQGDVWRATFVNGEMRKQRAKLVFEDDE